MGQKSRKIFVNVIKKDLSYFKAFCISSDVYRLKFGLDNTWENKMVASFVHQLSGTVLLRTNKTQPILLVKCPFSRGRDP